MSAAAASRGERLVFIDVLRGFAALAVVLEHAFYLGFPGYQEWALNCFDLGRFGVTLFLLLSGFVVPLSLERCGSNARFWVQRFFRLFPLYWLSIGLAFVLFCATGRYPGAGGPPGTAVWLINLTMLQEFLRVPHVSGVFWTLTLELILYASFSIFYATGTLNRYVGIAWLGIMGLLAVGTLTPLVLGLRFPAGYAFLYLSALMGHVLHRRLVGQIGAGQTWTLLAGLWAVGMLTAFINFHWFPHTSQAMSWGSVVACWAAAYGAFGAMWLLRRRALPGWMLFLGKVSYSIYLLHPVIMLSLPATLPGPVFVAATVVITVGVSALTFFLIEEPCLRLGKRLTRFGSGEEKQGLETQGRRAA